MANAVIRDLSKVVGVMPESSAFTFLEPDAARTYPAFDIKFEPQPNTYKRKETRPTSATQTTSSEPRAGRSASAFCSRATRPGPGPLPTTATRSWPAG